ncbi:MAG: aminomethyl-transferring glycine dehydrogenase subunit GcvPA [Candidatus Thermoplasmatota archaeon]|nr:aminomethyl-transferring glycine dehydrogenase subunit GcvPA [Candidatus Thermoplasmatota archaeon]
MQRRMAALGIEDIHSLFETIPPEIRISSLDLPPGRSQQEVEEDLRTLGCRNTPFYHLPSFLGGGIQPHYVPPAVTHLLSRSEFYTAYTPYQPEFSQGILQAMFEYQSVVCELTGMDAANVSMYDAATALGEAARMVKRIGRKKNFLIPANLPWVKKSVLANYVRNIDLEIREMPVGDDGRVDLDAVPADDVAGIYLETPSFYGLIEHRIDALRRLKERTGALLVMGVDPLLLAVATPPTQMGADVVIGDGWMGNHLNFGGLRLGLFACRREHIRQMPGRIIGATRDSQGRRAFCMTMQTREQHIRREKATSNICSNQALCAVAFVAYVALLGPEGLRRLAVDNMEKARYAAERLADLGFHLPFGTDFFNEFVAVPPMDAGCLNRELLTRNLHGGLPLGLRFPGPDNGLLYGVTEMHSREMIDRLVEATAAILEAHHV